MYADEKVVVSDDKIDKRKFKTSVKYTKYDFLFYSRLIGSFISLNRETNEIDVHIPGNSELYTIKINGIFEYPENVFEMIYKWHSENIHEISKRRAFKIFKDAERTLKECIDESIKRYEYW